MSGSENTEKKIIIDEDWKAQAQAEKEELARKQQETEPAKAAHAEADAESGPPAQAAGEAAAGLQWPEPSLELLVSTLAAQAMMALGLMPNPASGKSQTDLAQARHFIGTLEMLLQKTQGNRSEEETRMFEEVLHQLRMGFVAVENGRSV